MGIKKILVAGGGLHSASLAATTSLAKQKVIVVEDGGKTLHEIMDEQKSIKYKSYRIQEPEEQEPHVYNHMPYIRKEAKVYPNDPCTCGSGKKHKKCCRV